MLREEFPGVRLLENGENLGFGAANNRALELASGKYVFYLNSDTILLNNAVKLFYDYFELHQDERLGALGGMLLDERHNFIHSGGRFPLYKESILDLIKLNAGNIVLTLGTIFHVKNMHKNHFARESYGPLDFITGADLFVKNDKYARYDEDFFLYYEDTYLQYCMAQAGLERRLIQGPQIVHLCGGSVGQGISIYRKASFSRINFEFSRIKFLRKITQKRSFVSSFSIAFCKFLIIFSWLNPFILKKTRPYIKKLQAL